MTENPLIVENPLKDLSLDKSMSIEKILNNLISSNAPSNTQSPMQPFQSLQNMVMPVIHDPT